ncbi:hypothetical protein NDU88_004241 [Pleurodeles waltl]|uniref:Uncharacterized protein n=1 Tax=Pleurodeles waltl TaxID=8319 RepID=A0AAV7VJR9_PLEWA|nr:hypothetical protein NDU88_004241 [Pleurodeles waltl]
MVQGGRRVQPDRMMPSPVQAQCDLRRGFQFAWCGTCYGSASPLTGSDYYDNQHDELIQGAPTGSLGPGHGVTAEQARTPYLILGPTAHPCTPAGTEAFVPHCWIHLRVASECDGTQVFNVVGYQLQAVSHTGLRQACTATPSSSSAGSKSGHAAGRALGDRALSSTDWAHELHVRLGASNMRLRKGWLPGGRPRSSPPALPTAGVFLRTFSQGLAAPIAGPLASVLGSHPCLRPGLQRAAAAVGRETYFPNEETPFPTFPPILEMFSPLSHPDVCHLPQ